MKEIVSLMCLVLMISLCAGCRISEFFCDNGECVGLDKFCDGQQHCSDASDETKFCTRCNRTYYGDRYKTYTLDLTDTLQEKLPFICLLTFMAGGGELGDIVELTFSRFNLGKLEEPSEGTPESLDCQGGYLQILERGASTDKAGKFCGTTSSLPVYYSETNNVSLALFVFHVPGSQIASTQDTLNVPRDADFSDSNIGYMFPKDNLSRARVSSPGLGGSLSPASSVVVSPVPVPNLSRVGSGTSWGGSQSGFEFAVKFRFISRIEAVTRYGPPYSPYHRGEWIPETACDRSFQDCDSQPCKLQSPNFPGLYPRNVTCLFHITQRTIPRRQHALVSLHQVHEDKVSVKDQEVSAGSHESQLGSFARFSVPHEKHLLFGEGCLRHDFIRVYDGSDTTAPILATFCREGALPPLIASGPEMVIEFQTASLDVLELHSFELNVDVQFVAENDVGVRMNPQPPHKCEWLVDGAEKRSGIVYSLRHLAQANTSCTVAFRGKRHDVVWLYFVKYSVDRSAHDMMDVEDERKGDNQRAAIFGELYDGIPNSENSPWNMTVLETFSAEKSVRLCVHARNFPGFVPLRPCRYPEESYLSTGSTMFLRYNFTGAVNLQYLKFEARYEFVNTYMEGDPASSTSSFACSRVLRSSQRIRGEFTSPKNVFLFGRGGQSSLACTYKFIGKEGETIRLVFRKLRLGNRKCDSPFDPYSRRYSCRNEGSSSSMIPFSSTSSAQITVSQTLWGRFEVPVACICKLEREVTLEVMSNMATVNFTIDGMTTLDDFTGIYFEATYEFLSNVQCMRDKFLLDRPNGEVTFQITESDLRMQSGLPGVVRCPWFLTAGYERMAYLKISGSTALELCDTRNRVVVFTPDDLEPLVSICPSPSIPMATVHGASRSFQATSTSVHGSNGQREVEVYPKAWNRTTNHGRHFGRLRASPNLLMEFFVVEPGRFAFKWARSDRTNSANRLLGRRLRSDGQCVSGCNNNAGGCKGSSGSGNEGDDGLASAECEVEDQHGSLCPAGGGGGAACFVAHFPWLYVGIGIGCGVLVTTVLVVSLVHRRRETKAKKGKPVPTDEFPMDGKELDC